MDHIHYKEMVKNLDILLQDISVYKKSFYVFGHCNASEELTGLLMERGCKVEAIFDNNISKQGTVYKGIPIVQPNMVLMSDADRTIVCIVARAHASMTKQLRQMGYTGIIKKLVEYDSYAEYSLSEETIREKKKRVARGMELLEWEKKQYSGCHRIYCPFSALGDVYYAMAYLPYYLKRKSIHRYVVFTIGNACAEVAGMFGAEHVEALSQKDMDESIQAVLYTEDKNAYIPHQDRPYTVKLARVLYIKKIPLEMIYKYGVYELAQNCVPYKPVKWSSYEYLDQIRQGRAVVLSPYAKSVTNILPEYWSQIVKHFQKKGYQIFTNAVGEEKTLEGTLRLEIRISDLQSVVERAGTFIGIRSGLCDVIREAKCRKIALYPDCCYSDTRWKMEEIYHLDSFENIVVK